MLYQNYELQNDIAHAWRTAADHAQWAVDMASWGPAEGFKQRFMAGLEMVTRFELTHTRPDFGINEAWTAHRLVPVREEVALALPFGNLLHFAKDIDIPQPRILVIAPLSGHFATLLRGTVQTLLRDHDVYLTDWANARDVPVSAGRFGIDDYTDYLIRFLEQIGEGAHILAVCQPCVQALAAVAVMSEQGHACTPRSMTLMAGPIDPRESPTSVNELAVRKALSWFEDNVIANVPLRHSGRGRRVYPGFVQLTAFLAMNMERHRAAHKQLYVHLAAGEIEEAEKIKTFYDEYFAVLDLTEEFYIETIDRVFQRAELAEGTFTWHGAPVDPAAIHRTALLTVEGGRDDICGLGQTAAAHELCRSLRPHLKRHHFQANAGHFSVFSGRRWEKEIYPVVRNLILAVE